MRQGFPEIRELAVIGDRRTAALVTTEGSIVWYCPGRFDRPSLFASLLDPERGGSWKFEAKDAVFKERRYLEDSGVLESVFQISGEEFKVTDWMPNGDALPRGICRQISPAVSDIELTLYPAPNYARHKAVFRQSDGATVEITGRGGKEETFYLYASHRLQIFEDRITWLVPKGEKGWALLLDKPLEAPAARNLDKWLEMTMDEWRKIASHITYHGPYEKEVAASIRALRLLTFEENGGIIAAPTASLPEVIGGHRNYDYRYVWLRDTAMIVSSLIRAGSDGTEDRRFLDFICEYDHDYGNLPLLPFLTLGGEPAPDIETLELTGYKNSQPVRIGNVANTQLQHDAYGNVLLAAKLIYNRFKTRQHWHLIEELADFLADNWHQPDYGIWEEEVKHQYTSGKVNVACGLKFIAEHSQNEAQAKRWLAAVKDIREYVAKECINSEGAYAAYAGSEAVDVSAALFPVWDYIEPDTPEMLATMKALERDYSTNNLYRRHLVEFDSRKEGAFLAGTLWVAQYWIMRRDFQKARTIINAALEYSNDLGFFAEEADPKTGEMLGNFPQTFVHAALLGAVIDLKAALEEKPERTADIIRTF